jgi:uncharacterized protein
MYKKNVLGEDLLPCCTDPATGYYRDGYCRTGTSDSGRHTVCAQVTEAFLAFSLQQGNDLITPRPEYRFPGLQPGDKWCLCAQRWKEAYDHGVAPPVFLAACAEESLTYISLDQLIIHGI